MNHTGTLRQITINDLPVGRSVDETLRLIQAFQFTDENGEVCPANWDPTSNKASLLILLFQVATCSSYSFTLRQDTIKTDPTAKLEYFSKDKSAAQK